MTQRARHVVLCRGILCAAVVAWAVGWGLAGRYGGDVFDVVVGGSGVVAAVCAVLALPRSRGAAVPLIITIAVAALMTFARLPDPDFDGMDFTPVMLPPVLFVLAGIALMMINGTPERRARHD
ncbi:hypothetical protein [Aeromicrobium fastidiosum]